MVLVALMVSALFVPHAAVAEESPYDAANSHRSTADDVLAQDSSADADASSDALTGALRVAADARNDSLSPVPVTAVLVRDSEDGVGVGSTVADAGASVVRAAELEAGQYRIIVTFSDVTTAANVSSRDAHSRAQVYLEASVNPDGNDVYANAGPYLVGAGESGVSLASRPFVRETIACAGPGCSELGEIDSLEVVVELTGPATVEARAGLWASVEAAGTSNGAVEAEVRVSDISIESA